MADDARKPVPDLTKAPLPDRDTDFFQLLRLLERDGKRFGRGSDPENEPARLGQHVRLNFAARDIAEVGQEENRPPQVNVQLLGLLGPEGPMPLHLTRWTFDRSSERWFTGGGAKAEADTTFSDLCNLLQHRMMTLFWRAWSDTRPEVETERGENGRVRAMLAALGGIGLPGTQIDDDLDPIKLRQAAGLAQEARGPERLTLLLTELLGCDVALEEFIGNYVEIPPEQQTRLGRDFAALGQNAVAGARTFQRQNRIEVRIGPLSMLRFRSLFPGEHTLERVKKAILFAMGHELTVDIRLILAHGDVPPARIGTTMLGRTAWLPADTRDRDADDLRIVRLVGAAAPGQDLAA